MASLKWFCWIYCSCLQYRHLKQTSPIYVLWPRKCAKLDIFKLKKCCIYVWHFGVFISELKFWCLSVIMSRRTDIQCLLFLCVRLQVLQRQAKPNCTACITCAKRIWCKFVFLVLLSFGELRFRWVWKWRCLVAPLVNMQSVMRPTSTPAIPKTTKDV